MKTWVVGALLLGGCQAGHFEYFTTHHKVRCECVTTDEPTATPVIPAALEVLPLPPTPPPKKKGAVSSK